MSTFQPFGIHWFRRDLRCIGNPALESNLKQHHGRVLGIFFIDPSILARPDFSADRFQFFLLTLADLAKEMAKAGGELWVTEGSPEESWPFVIETIKKAKRVNPSLITWNRDYEPFALVRDEKIEKRLQREFGLQTLTKRDHLLIEPNELPTHKVYSAFARKWYERMSQADITTRTAAHRIAMDEFKEKGISKKFELQWKSVLGKEPVNVLDEWIKKNSKKVQVPMPEAGFAAALKRLGTFESQVDAYGERRDFPWIDGTSKISHFLKTGTLTAAQVIATLGLQTFDPKKVKERTGKQVYLSELVWREFSYSILVHFPQVEKEAFLEKYKDLKWQNREDFFEAWKEGRTGYPIVDAAMRQLNQTGWMHNRLRMIVASFLTKDLLVDWRWGERYFMNRLLDGDLGPNNFGWQWSASTGCDPQPYFRIFNPIEQGKKFDPEGRFIRKYLPERAKMTASKEVLAPFAPIVEHSKQRDLALKLYQN